MIKVGQVSAVHADTKTIDVYFPDDDTVMVNLEIVQAFGASIVLPAPPQQVLVAFVNNEDAYVLGTVNES